MPGIPSGRGCDACRKQKKKCDQTKPACSRCERLRLECVGSGQQRFIFKDQTRRYKPLPKERKISTNPSSNQTNLRPCYSPSNNQDQLTLAFIDAVRISANLKYSLSWAYGSFLADVPKRLGTNKALDAASRALIASHLCFSTPGRIISCQALSEYTKAIRVLRLSLDDPAEACSASTLCAVNILLITQGFIGVSENRSISHCQGAAHILKARGIRYNAQDEFERGLFSALRGPVLFEGLFNREIQFSLEEWDQLIQNDLDKVPGTGFMMKCLARVPSLVNRGRKAFKEPQSEEVSVLHTEVQDLYNRLLKNADDLKKHYEEGIQMESLFEEISDQEFSLRVYAHWQRTYGLALTIAMFFNLILRSLVSHPFETSVLELDAAQLASETISVANDAVIFRPLGSSYMILCLVASWSSATCAETKKVIEELLRDYLSDFPKRREQTELDLGVVARHFDLRSDEGLVDIRCVSSGGYRIC